MMKRAIHFDGRQNGFTLLELLVVFAIIAILVTLVLSVVPMFFQKADSTITLGNMRQLGAAVELYAADHSFGLPGRVTGKDESKWPVLLAAYLKDSRAYAASGVPNFVSENKDPLNNSQNCTSFILNGFNDRGAYDNETVRVRLNQLSQPGQVILFGMQIDSGNFYMDFVEKNQDGVLKLDAYDNASIYVFADGSARLLGKVDYESPMPGTNIRHGDWLWLADKNSAIPQ